ncbi:MAG: ABC transporter permease [Bacilli bacterium]
MNNVDARLPTDDSQPVPAAPRAKSRRWLNRLGDFWTLGILVIILAVFGILQPSFLSVSNWFNTTTYMTETLLLAIGETYVIITAGIDLSVGAVEGLAGIVAALVMVALEPQGAALAMVAGTLAGMLTGALFGFLNGWIITAMKVTPFIVTLGTMGIATGLTFILSGGTDVVNLPNQLSNIGNATVLGVFSFPTFVTVLCLIAAGVVLYQTRFGRYVYAIGSNAEAARRAGVPVSRNLIKVYTVSGAIAALSGILLLTRFATGSPLTGANDELNAIAAVVIGGTSLFGGRGTIVGTLIGAAIISVLITGLVILSVQPYWQTVAIGVIIIIAVWIDQFRHRMA